VQFENSINYLNVNDARTVGIKYLFLRKITSTRLLEWAKRKMVGEGVYFSKAFDRTKSVFVHIPKAAGTSVSKAFYGARQGHHTALAYKASDPVRFARYYKFSIVRNPYSRLYSTYNYLLNSPHLEDNEWAQKNISQYKDFNDFVCNWVNAKNILTWKHFLPQSYFLCDEDGNLLVDDIGNMENMAEIFSEVSLKLNFKGVLPQENVMGKTVNGYRKHYSDASMEVVSQVYGEDLRRFNYEF
jgi:Sulfotransferase family.